MMEDAGRCKCVVFGIRRGQTSLRKHVTDLNTGCNHRVLCRVGPAQLMAASSIIPQKIQTVEIGGREQTAGQRKRRAYKSDTFSSPGTQWHGRREKRWERSRVWYTHANVVSSRRTGQEFSHHKTTAHAPDDIRHPSYFRWGKSTSIPS